MGRVVAIEALAAALEAERGAGRRIVLTNGCFDVLHVGHARGLQRCRALGDVLVEGVTGDESVRRLKGPGRPVVAEAKRAELLAALAAVDYVAIVPEPTAERLAALVRPYVFVKCADYTRATGAVAAAPEIDEDRLPEARVERAARGAVVLLPLTPGHSTSALLERIQAAGRGPAGAGHGGSPARQ